MEHILLATYQRDITPYVDLAQAHGAGLEVQVYGYDTGLLDDEQECRKLLDQHKAQLQGFEGKIAIHGAFYDLSPASPDQRIVKLVRERYLLNLDIAAELGACHVVFHANFFPIVRNPAHRPNWTERQVEFWGPMAEEAAKRGVVVALENMWEPDPGIIGDVLDRVDSPHVCACLDVGHVYLFSDYVPLKAWIERLEHRLVHCHLNNHRGFYDEHLPLDLPGGVIDYKRDVLPLLRALPDQPLLVLEMDDIEYLRRSLRYLGR
jgi:sugar phosphate isomerase/epimerase